MSDKAFRHIGITAGPGEPTRIYVAGAPAPAPGRKLIRQVIEIEVLREDGPLDEDLSAIAHDISDGDSSGVIRTVLVEEVSGPRMAELLRAQGSDPGFLGLDEAGKDIL